jgi:beta-glucosidase
MLREDWQFKGYITSDSDSCDDIYSTHHMAPDAVHAAADCLAGGTDINSGGT